MDDQDSYSSYMENLTKTDFAADEPYNNTMIDAITVGGGAGIRDSALLSAFTGINHRFASIPLAKNRERSGITFFTRPNMNLSPENMLKSRKLAELYISQTNSSNSAIMSLLDPYNRHLAADPKSVYLGCRLKDGVPVNNQSPFIPFLTNLLDSLSGFPDSTLDVYRSVEGIRREQVSMVDSTYHINNSFSLNASFRNVDGDPVTTFFNLYLEYMSYVAEGIFYPRPYSIYANELDYNMRIIRFNMDPTGRFITKYGVGIAGFPTNDNYGAAMNVQTNNPFITDNDTINIQFEVNGAEYNDPYLLYEFNELVAMYNPAMKDPKSTSDYFLKTPDLSIMKKLKPSELLFFNCEGYPHANLITKELTWWVTHEMYDAKINELARSFENDQQINTKSY